MQTDDARDWARSETTDCARAIKCPPSQVCYITSGALLNHRSPPHSVAIWTLYSSTLRAVHVSILHTLSLYIILRNAHDAIVCYIIIPRPPDTAKLDLTGFNIDRNHII